MRTINIGGQDFAAIRENNCFYVDKTDFIREWWEAQDTVTLITRPRRFGKTLNMSMLECFFSDKYTDRGDLFAGLQIWQYPAYRALQGTQPVIFLTFADIKSSNYEDALAAVKRSISKLYSSRRYLLDSGKLTEDEKAQFRKAMEPQMPGIPVETAIRDLMEFMSRARDGEKVIVLLDEYDTPMQEAYVSGYWEKIVALFRGLFNATFKTNPFLSRALMTGITRVSKESIFSDLNNLRVVTTTTAEYATAFGFTEGETFAALDEMALSGCKDDVKSWYDGFTFGKTPDIYNPWSIINFLNERKLGPYWANSSSNGLVGKLIREGDPGIKTTMEDLLAGKPLVTYIDEQIVFSQLDDNENAIWSLLLASGYLKIVTAREYYSGDGNEKPEYTLALTNTEVRILFEGLIEGWFKRRNSRYNDFIKALMLDDLDYMNEYMADIVSETVSSFDVATRPSGKTEPERFYHGLVLGMMVDLKDRYRITSNRESGLGRYDVMLEPVSEKDPAFVFEFKVRRKSREKDLSDTVAAALQQIEEKNYDAVLISRGIAKERIRHYGFAFEGKSVRIG